MLSESMAQGLAVDGGGVLDSSHVSVMCLCRRLLRRGLGLLDFSILALGVRPGNWTSNAERAFCCTSWHRECSSARGAKSGSGPVAYNHEKTSPEGPIIS